ncbi:RDD family protein [Alkaliphilus hydrothermalis]|uniref:RDD family membrane protein YckC n=1 Tax=Alkaliphilus hydrothermalis TaxID=1482730 RepID=A0ABS2NN60_9FIRM|nr:RDD family protein [Alkaliphilus hydrothermalis]MBM7614344.1 putative RDD family membrane protein YckC [Alkaliphilus hydrothermalis]
MNGANFKIRIKALIIDYLCILAYLIILFIITISIYNFLLKGIPQFTEIESQWISFISTVFPITTYFIIKESRKPYASFGKKKMGLKIVYKDNPIKGSIIRNIFKFLPWQFAHLSIIKGIYTGFDSFFVLGFYVLAVLLPVVYILMVAFRKDHRHLPDLFACTRVVSKTR